MNMNNLSIRQKQIFQILLNANDFIPCKEIAMKLNVSIRTVKSDIMIIKDSLTDVSCTFESVPSKGYKIQCHNIEKIKSNYLTNSYFFSANKYLEDDFRQLKIFFDLLNCEESIKVKYLTDKYYISRTTLYKDLDCIAKEIEGYHVDLIYKPYEGIYINGTEINIRFAVQNKLLLNMASLEEDCQIYFHNLQFTKDNLLNFINSFAINKISDFELSNLYHHLLAMLMRCKINKYISYEDLYYETFVNEFEIQKAYKYFYMNKPKSLTIPRSEIIYFVLLIKGCNLGFCNQIALDVTVQAVAELSNQLKLDLNDSTRIADLSQYMYSLLIRNFNHFIQNTVLLDDIREKHSLSFDMSFRLVNLIEKALKIKIDNNEISYLSYFFLDIQDVLKDYYIPNKILLVSFRGVVMCKNLLNDLQSNFSLYDFEICELYELIEKTNENDYSFIITDVAVHIDKDIPIILISHFLDTEDYKLVRKHLRIILSDLIDDYLDNMIINTMHNKFDFLDYISYSEEEKSHLFMREKRLTYQIKNAVIIYLFNQKSKTAIYYNEKGLVWDTKEINYIFVINVTENNHLLNYFKAVNMFFRKISA